MKKIFILINILIISGCVNIQYAEQKSIENIEAVPNKNKAQIHATSKIWIAENFSSAKAVIEIDDPESGLIIGNGAISYPCDANGSCRGKEAHKVLFTMRLDIKDQKIKATFTNMRVAYLPGGEYPLIQDEFELIKNTLLDISKNIALSTRKSSSTNW